MKNARFFAALFVVLSFAAGCTKPEPTVERDLPASVGNVAGSLWSDLKGMNFAGSIDRAKSHKVVCGPVVKITTTTTGTAATAGGMTVTRVIFMDGKTYDMVGVEVPPTYRGRHVSFRVAKMPYADGSFDLFEVVPVDTCAVAGEEKK